MGIVAMPSLGADMEEGTLIEWTVAVGDTIARGDVIAVIETQKGAIEIECFEAGVVSEILIGEGHVVPVGTPLARISDPTAQELPDPTPPEVPPETPTTEPPAPTPEMPDQGPVEFPDQPPTEAPPFPPEEGTAALPNAPPAQAGSQRCWHPRIARRPGPLERPWH